MSHVKPKIRQAELRDLKAIQDLNYALFVSDSQSDPLLNLEWPYEKEGEEYFKKRIEEKGIIFVAEIDGKIVGYVTGAVNTEKETSRKIKLRGELENTLVLEEYRSQGIGTLLAERLIKWLKSEGAERVVVYAYAPNERAIEFYKRYGFEPYVVGLEIGL